VKRIISANLITADYLQAIEKLILKRLKLVTEEKHLVPAHHFGFRNNHSTIDQVHRITDINEKTLENKGLFSAVFLDIVQAFGRLWHRGLRHKLRSILPDHFCQLLKSYLANRHFRVKYEDSYSELKQIKAGVPHERVFGLVLYLLYINDVPVTSKSTMATFADDTAIMAVGETV
jgi:hypothetical protein